MDSTMEEKPLMSPKSSPNNHAINSQSVPFSNDKETVGEYPEPTWRRKYAYIFFPIEVIVFLFMFGVYFQMQVYQQYYFKRVFEDVISNWTNVSQLNYSVSDMCLDQDLVVNLTSPDAFVEGQKKLNTFSMLNTISYLLPSILVSPFIGTISDQIGRKPAIFFVFVGQLIAAVVGPIIVYLKLNMLLFFIGSFATGLFGGFGMILSSSFAYVTDVTPKKWLTIRMAVLEASIFVATAVSSASAGTWIQQTNCSFKPQVWLILATVACGMFYSLIIPESLPKDQLIKQVSDYKCDVSRLIRGFKLFFGPSYIGLGLIKVWIIVGVTVLAMINETGTSEISSYFLHNKPLQWNYNLVGIYLAVSSVSHLIGLVIILPILVVLKVPDSVISMVGVVVSCGMFIYIAVLKNTWEMFIAGVILGLQSVVMPGLRSLLAGLLRKEDRGAAFSILAMFQLLATLIASVIFNEVYTPSSIDNSKDNPKLVYWMGAGIWALGIPLLGILIVSDTVKYLNHRGKKIKFVDL